jgi:hypothetical protein
VSFHFVFRLMEAILLYVFLNFMYAKRDSRQGSQAEDSSHAEMSKRSTTFSNSELTLKQADTPVASNSEQP